MKELDIPYIGVKIESIPTILNVLEKSSDDSEFISYYLNLEKSKKTATEYLASLRNLLIAKKDNSGNTRILPFGKLLLEDEIQNFYSNLWRHCIKHFPELKIIQKITKNANLTNDQILKKLADLGYTVKRKQTLSSFTKLSYESTEGNFIASRKNISNVSKKEKLEFNQFIKILGNSLITQRKIILVDLYREINSKYKFDRSLFEEYLTVLLPFKDIHFLEVNPNIISNEEDAFVLNDRYYYFVEKS